MTDRPHDGTPETTVRSGVGAADPARPRRRWLSLPAVLWVVGTAVCTLMAVYSSLTFFGAPVPPERARASDRWFLLAGVFCLGAPLLGLGLACAARSRAGRWAYAVMAVVGALPWIGWWGLVVHEQDSRPATPSRYVCQEHSGGDTQCPGG